MSKTVNEITSSYDYDTYVPLDLRKNRPTYVDVNALPLSGAEREIILRVQGVNRAKERYILGRKGEYKLTKIEDSGTAFDGYWLDWLTAKVYKDRAMKEEYQFHIDSTGYLVGKHIGLHRLVALQWLRLTNKELFEKAKGDGRYYQVHHRKPWLRNTQEGNNIWNVEVLDWPQHKRYESILDRLITAYDKGQIAVLDSLNRYQG